MVEKRGVEETGNRGLEVFDRNRAEDCVCQMHREVLADWIGSPLDAVW